MKNKPLVSICCTCKNAEQTIRRHLDSIVAAASCYDNIEYIVQDGGSTDSTLAIFEEYRFILGDKLLLVSKLDTCASEGFWRTIFRCRGDIICASMADEEILPNAIPQVVDKFMNNPDIDVIHGDIYQTDIDGNIQFINQSSKFELCRYLSQQLPMHFASSFFRKAAFESAGFLPPPGRYGLIEDDFIIWCYLGLFTRLLYCPTVFAKYAVHPDALTVRPDRLPKIIEDRARFLPSFFSDKNIPKSVFLKRKDCLIAFYAWAARRLIEINHLQDAQKYVNEFEVLRNERMGSSTMMQKLSDTSKTDTAHLHGAERLDQIIAPEIVNDGLIGATRQVNKDYQLGDSFVQHDSSITSGEPAAVRQLAHENCRQRGQHMNSPVTYLKAIEYMVDGGQQEVAYWAMGKLVEDFPDNAQLYNEMGVLAYEQGDQHNAREYFKQALHLESDNIQYLKNYGDFCYVVQNDVKGALAQYEKIIGIDPDNIEILMMSGHVSTSLHRYRKAQQYYMQVLRLDPNNREVREIVEKINQAALGTNTRTISAAGLYDAARSKILVGNRAAAIALLQQLVAQDDAHGLAHNDLGVLNYEIGNMESALKHYQKAADLMPENETFQKNLADFCWAEMGDHQRAMERYVQVLKLNPQDVEAQLGCGQICLSLGKEADALDFINIVLKLEPGNEDARMMRNQLGGLSGKAILLESENDSNHQFFKLAAQKGYATSMDELTQQLAASPDDPVLHNDLGVLYYKPGDKENALTSFKKAVRLAPNELNYHKNLAEFYMMEEGRAEEAMKIYVEVLSLNPQDVEALNATGLICATLGKTSDARYFYDRVLEIEPWNENAANALKNFPEVAVGEFPDKKIDRLAR